MVKEYRPTTRVANIITIIDIAIVTLNMIFFKEIEIGLYSAITIFIMGKIIDILFEGINFSKLIFIISNKNEEISKQIRENVQRGVTGLYGKGMHKNQERLILMCAAPRSEANKIKIIAKKIDSNSFIVIVNSREVVGLGFKKE